jgi:YHS domain-containing protein
VAVAVRVARYDAPAPSPATAAVAPAAVSSGDHSGHQHAEETPVPAESETVNSVCPICGMDVDPSLPPATYEGKRVGFGCKACPPKFAADPDKYGPFALKNEVAP